jgi:hypothetical protein
LSRCAIYIDRVRVENGIEELRTGKGGGDRNIKSLHILLSSVIALPIPSATCYSDQLDTISAPSHFSVFTGPPQ